MPEYPDITVYIEALEERIADQRLNKIRLTSPFLLRTAVPSIDDLLGKSARSLKRIGKRIAIGFEEDLWMVYHLMIAGRFHWQEDVKKMPGKKALISMVFDNGILYLTEAGTKKRASLHIVKGESELTDMDPGGLEIFEINFKTFSFALTHANHTLKRALTDPRIFSGIGNAYSDEILHHARLSPITQTQKLGDEEIARLYDAIKHMLKFWTDTLRKQYRDKFPEKVAAFRKDMAVHGRYNQPCPVCQTPVQRIRYATNETNYCPKCQTGGKVLADRSLSRLLKKDWPRSIEELEKLSKRGKQATTK